MQVWAEDGARECLPGVVNYLSNFAYLDVVLLATGAAKGLYLCKKVHLDDLLSIRHHPTLSFTSLYRTGAK
jgi:hypothetical protein